jgi:excinuclease ABC subunit C
MNQLSKENKFEEAGKVRDKISNLQQVMSHTNVINNEKVGGTSDVPPTLNRILGVDKEIHRIECYDVSNIQGKQATGSMVVFIDGKPDKNQYRKFRIKMKNEPNDIAMLKETLERRFSHPKWKYPEVILIDGGIAQLNVAINVKNRKPKTKNIRVISIAKRNKDLYIEGKKGFIPLKSLQRKIYNLILQLDDEAHRFAITYHKKLRRDNLLT